MPRRVILLWLAAPPVGVGLAVALLRPTPADLRLIAQFLVLSEAASLLLAWGALRLMRGMGVSGIQAKLSLTYALGVGIVLINIALSSMPMFLSTHDSLLLAVLLLFGAMVALGFGQLMVRSMTGGLEELAQASTAIAAGDLSRRVAVETGDEVEEVGRAFNDMAERLDGAQRREADVVRAQRSLIAAASHDLRTPLTSLRATIEAISEGLVVDRDQVARYLDVAQGEIHHLSRLVDDLFELTQLHAGVLVPQLEAASLRDLVSDTIQALHLPAAERGLTLEGGAEPDVDPLWMDPYLMQRALNNLVENAVRHTPSGGTVSVRAERLGDLAKLSVADSGEGIPAEDIPHVFEAFYRGEAARSRGRGVGAGLGLTITRAIVEAHRGTIGVVAGPNGGVVFEIRLPAGPPGGE